MKLDKKTILARLRNTEQSTKKRAAKLVMGDKPKTENMIINAQVGPAIQQIKTAKEQLMSLSLDKYQHVGKPLGNEKIKILSLSDLHVPFENTDTILHALKTHGDADILVVNGDFLEQYAVSRWGKSKTVLLEWEYKIAIEWMKLFSSMFEEVHIVRGNHDDRLQKYIADAVDPMVNFMIEDDILVRLAQGYDFNSNGKFEKVYDFDNVYYTPGQLGWQTRIGKCIFAHPSSSSGIPMRTVITAATSFMTNESFQALVIGHCFDEETELLTDNGWRSIDTIKQEDKPLTLNTETNILEFNNCEGIFEHNNHKEVIAFQNDSGLEVIVTPEHGMLYSTYKDLDKRRTWDKANAQEIENYNRFSIPASGILENEEKNKISDYMLKLLARIITKGNIHYTSIGNSTIEITQPDDGSYSVQEIKFILDLLRIEHALTHKQYRNFNAYVFYIGVQESTNICKLLDLKTKTFKHDLLKSLSLRQRKLLIEEMCKCDGSKCGTDHCCQYYTENKTLLDQFQMLCTLSGIRTKANINKYDGTWVISMTNTNIHTVTSSERREYNGRTWCLTVPNGTLVARRKGVVFFTQNTHKMGKLIWRDKLLIEQGCCCVPLDYQSDGKMKYLPQAFGYAVVWMDEYGNVDFENSNAVYRGTGYPTKSDLG